MPKYADDEFRLTINMVKTSVLWIFRKEIGCTAMTVEPNACSDADADRHGVEG